MVAARLARWLFAWMAAVVVCLNALLPVPAGAVTLTVAFDSAGDAIQPDWQANVLHRSNTGAPFEAHVTSDPDDRTTRSFFFIPQNASFVQDVALRFRLEGLAGPIGADSMVVTDGSGTYKPVTIVDQGEGFAEFTYPFPAVLVWSLPQSLVIYFNANILEDGGWARMSFQLAPPFRIDAAEVSTSPVDHWYRLSRNAWPGNFIDGEPIPDGIAPTAEPVGGEQVQVEGTGVRFAPASATTDSDGLFGVAAFVDPDSFYAAKASGLGELRLKYRNLMSTQQITGNFCEVILVEGTVRVVEGTGTVGVGDLLYPGQRLSLGASWGQKAQLGLRFVNGTDASVIQDVFTNACLADMITIGSNGIENDSVLQGNTPLMSVSRTLCEEVAGLPNTPGEWATATGKVIVKQAASSLVGAGGIVGYAIKYGVKAATGKAYDQVINSGSGTQMKGIATGPARAEFSTYYDGSSRFTHSAAEPLRVMAAGAATPLATLAAGQWQEVVAADSLGRAWPEGPDTIDQSGPDLRLSAEYVAASSVTILDVRASDPAGLDAASLAVRRDSLAITSAFREQPPGSGHWVGQFVGAVGGTAIELSLADQLGHVSTLVWSQSTAPAAPGIAAVDPGSIGGAATLVLTPPVGLAAGDVLFHEVRLAATNASPTPWRSVGNASTVRIAIPSSFAEGLAFRLEVRASDRAGRIGATASTTLLHAHAEPQDAEGWMMQ